MRVLTRDGPLRQGETVEGSEAKNVLGVHGLSHDAGAALIAGERVRSISEERLTRRKHDDAFPQRSIAYLLEDAGLTLDQIDLVVVDHLDGKAAPTLAALRELGYGGEAVAIRHHEAHAASAFLCSPFQEAAVLVVDGGGSFGEDCNPGARPHYAQVFEPRMYEAQSLYRGAGSALHLARRTILTHDHPFGIGYFYEAVTRYLGFGSFGGGKTMGLAPYGTGALRAAEPIFRNYEGDIVVAGDGPSVELEALLRYRDRYFGGVAPRAPGEEIGQAHMELADLVQRELEEAMLALAHHAHGVTGSRNVCLAGGVALNCVTNRRILDETGFEHGFFQPACSDAGIPLGCALWGAHVHLGRPRFWTMRSAFLGREYGAEAIDRAIARTLETSARTQPLSVRRFESSHEVADAAARLMSKGRIVAWFQGAAELGPRALGNRSIVCDPRRPNMKDVLNERVKHREYFRPFAPAVLAERCGEYFELSRESPHMLLIAPVRSEKRREIPAVVHVDGTARVQTVSREDNPRFRELIERFEHWASVPVILNTSLNVAGEPIVETPEDALACFLGTAIDALAIGDVLLEKTPS